MRSGSMPELVGLLAAPVARSIRDVIAMPLEYAVPPDRFARQRTTRHMAYVIAEPCIGHEGQLLRRGLPGRLHPPDAGRARLRQGRAALHRSRGVHRLRRLRRGLPGRRLLRRGPAPGRVVEVRPDQRASTSPASRSPRRRRGPPPALVLRLVTIGRQGRRRRRRQGLKTTKESPWDFERSRTPHGGIDDPHFGSMVARWGARPRGARPSG